MALDTSNPAIERLGLPSMQGGESTHGVASGCGTKGTKFEGTTGCPTSFPTGPGLGASFDRALWRKVGRTIGTEARGLNNQAIKGDGDVGSGGVPGIPTNGKSGLFFLDPNINLMRDPRWGRAQEVPGEDPYLTGEYGSALVDATQRGPEDPRYLLAASTIKHWSMYDMEGYIPREDPGKIDGGYCDTPGGCQRWNFDMTPPLDQFVDFYLKPFKAAVQRARPASIMCSYNSAYGLPTCANSQINEMVRAEWNWDGFFVSDCTALELMQNVKWDSCPRPWPSEGGSCTPADFSGGHNYTHTVGDTIHAALVKLHLLTITNPTRPQPYHTLSLHAPVQLIWVNCSPPNTATYSHSLPRAPQQVQGSIDYNCGALYRTNLYSSLKAGAVTESDVDTAAARIYTTMIRLGMLDPPEDQYYINEITPDDVDSEANRDAALLAARESLVLLKNDRKMLPLFGGQLLTTETGASTDLASRKVAFIGPHANSTTSLLGNYHGSNTLVNSWSPLMAAKAAGLDVSYARGVRICDYPYGKNPGFPNMPCDKAGNVSQVAAAADVARVADVAVLFLGSDQTTEAENFDRRSLALAGNGSQAALLRSVIAVQPNVVVVLINGGPISWNHTGVSAILEAFYPGELGGRAIVDALTGAYNPGGKLPYTNYIEENFSQQRDIRNTDLASGSGLTYQYYTGSTLFDFGWGLSFTEFTYTWASGGQTAVTVKNTGAVAGDAVVLAFVHDPNLPKATGLSALRAPLKRLAGFERVIGLQPGEERSVEIGIDDESVSFVHETTGQRVLVTGSTWTLSVGDVVAPCVRQLTVAPRKQGKHGQSHVYVSTGNAGEAGETGEAGDLIVLEDNSWAAGL